MLDSRSGTAALERLERLSRFSRLRRNALGQDSLLLGPYLKTQTSEFELAQKANYRLGPLETLQTIFLLFTVRPFFSLLLYQPVALFCHYASTIPVSLCPKSSTINVQSLSDRRFFLLQISLHPPSASSISLPTRLFIFQVNPTQASSPFKLIQLH